MKNLKVLLWKMPISKILNFITSHLDLVGAIGATYAYGTFYKDHKSKEQLMDALRKRDSGNSIIGVYGPGGMVKDSIKTAIRRSKRDNLFQIIVTATVTNKPDLAKIQTEIGRAMGLNFDDEMNLSGTTCCLSSDSKKKRKRMLIAERGGYLSDKLKQQQSVLVVLFDLHKSIDLGKIGIPCDSDHNGCKVLLTSTSHEALSNHMKIDTLIHITEEDASISRG